MVAAAETTVALSIAVVTLIGTISANVVGWYKAKRETEVQREQNQQEQKKSKVEIAQTVLVDTIEILNLRIQNERKGFEDELNRMRVSHAEDIARLERKIEEVTNEYVKCKRENVRLLQRISQLETGE